MNKDLDLKAIHSMAMDAAKTAANHYFQTKLHGVDCFPCGFAYVIIDDMVRVNSKQGKQLIELGFHKGHNSNRFERIIPSLRVQNAFVLETGSDAYAQVLRDHGINARSYSNLD